MKRNADLINGAVNRADALDADKSAALVRQLEQANDLLADAVWQLGAKSA